MSGRTAVKPETVAMVSAAIAAGSLLLNIIVAIFGRNYRTRVARDDELRARLYDLKHRLDGTNLLTVTPHYEMWEFGFQSLEGLREAAVRCNSILEIAPFGKIPAELKKGVAQLVNDIKELFRYRDSYTRFSKGERITSQEKIMKWPDFENAKSALSNLQGECRRTRPIIDNQLERMY